MASVTYGKCIIGNVIMAKVLWQMKLSPLNSYTFEFELKRLRPVVYGPSLYCSVHHSLDCSVSRATCCNWVDANTKAAILRVLNLERIPPPGPPTGILL